MADTILYSEYNETTRFVTTRDMLGNVIDERPYTASENADADARASKSTNEDTLVANAQAALTAMATTITNLQVITAKVDLAITPADTKAVATELVRVTKQVARLTRLQVKVFDTTL
jgi:hypothetical protein